jgi:hypothetical protein
VYGTDYDPHVQDVLTTGNSFSSVKNQLSVGANAFVAIFAMFGVGYYLGRQYTDDRTQVRGVGCEQESDRGVRGRQGRDVSVRFVGCG